MNTKQGFWMRYVPHYEMGGYEYVVVVAETLDEAYKKLTDKGIRNEDIHYLNRQLDVLE